MNNIIDPVKVPHFVINLARATERRQNITEQAERLGLDVRFIKATEGCNLTPEERALYSSKRRLAQFPKDITNNELGCSVSHLRALRAYVDSGEPYGVILEDDAVFADEYVGKLGWLINNVHGWECLKLCSEPGRYNAITEPAGPYGLQITAHGHVVWLSVACIYTLDAARKVVEHLQKFWEPSDLMIGHSVLFQKIPFGTCIPNIVSTSDPDHEKSCIDASGEDRSLNGCSRTVLQYIFNRYMVIRYSISKKKMEKMLRACIRVD